MNSNDLRSHSSPDTRSDTEAVPRSRHLLVPLTLLGLASLVPAQRFDQWSAAGTAGNPLAAHMVTDPGTGDPMVVTFGSVSTLRWDGSAFVTANTTGPATLFNFETMSAFSAGLVYLTAGGITHVRLSNVGTWTPFGPPTSPPARQLAAATTSVGPMGEAFVFGGAQGSTLLNDLWSFDGVTWTNLTPTGTSPQPRFSAGLAHDGLGGIVLHGGTDSTGNSMNDVWRFIGGTWVQHANAPTSRSGHMMVLDVSRSQIFIAGGSNMAGGLATPLNDAHTLSFAGGFPTFTQLPSPPAWLLGGGAFCIGALDAVRHELVHADMTFGELKLDKACSALVVAGQPIGCSVAPLGITNGAEPRVGGTPTVMLGGNLGVPNVTMFLNGAFVAPASLPIGAPLGGGCFTFLPAGAMFVGFSTSAGANGTYNVSFNIPPNPALVGLNVDFQAGGLDNSTAPPTIRVSDALRIVIGR